MDPQAEKSLVAELMKESRNTSQELGSGRLGQRIMNSDALPVNLQSAVFTKPKDFRPVKSSRIHTPTLSRYRKYNYQKTDIKRKNNVL